MALSMGIPGAPGPDYHDRARVELEGLVADLEREAQPLRERLEELGMQHERLSTALEAFGAVERSSEAIENAKAAFAVARAQRAQDELPQPVERPDVQTRHRRQESPLGRPDYRPRPPSTTADRLARIETIAKMIAEHGSVTMGDLTSALTLPRSTLKNDISVLLGTGKIQSVGKGRGMRYASTATLDAQVAAANGKDGSRFRNRDVVKVGDAIRTTMFTAGITRGMTELELADRLGMDREDVALACGTLLEDGRVVLGATGIYRWVTIGGSDGDRAADSGAGESERGALPAGEVEG